MWKVLFFILFVDQIKFLLRFPQKKKDNKIPFFLSVNVVFVKSAAIWLTQHIGRTYRLNSFLFLNVTVFKSMYRVKAEVLVDLKVCRWTHTFVTVCVLRLFLTASFAYFFIFFVQPGGADSLFQLSQGDSKLKTDPIPLLKPQQELTWCQKRVWGWRRPLLNQTLNITITTVEKSLYLLMLLHSILLKCQMKFKRLS